MQENTDKNRFDENQYNEIIEKLLKLSVSEIKSLALKEEDIPVLIEILEYKINKEKEFIAQELVSEINNTKVRLGM